MNPPGRGLNKLSSWYVDGTSTTLALSAPDGWTKVLLGALLAAARAKILLFVTYKDDRRTVDSMVVMGRAACGTDECDKWSWVIKSGERVADALGPVTWFGRPSDRYHQAKYLNLISN